MEPEITETINNNNDVQKQGEEKLLGKTLGHREKNELTASLIKKQIGDIEQIRAFMGLNKKRMCELLLIDPSTWTRWTTGKTQPPPSVYRTLQWGLAVMDKHPEFHPLLIKQSQTLAEPANSNTLQSKDQQQQEQQQELEKLTTEVIYIKKNMKLWFYIAFSALISSFLLTTYILIY